jgi:hypothetical protein
MDLQSNVSETLYLRPSSGFIDAWTVSETLDCYFFAYTAVRPRNCGNRLHAFHTRFFTTPSPSAATRLMFLCETVLLTTNLLHVVATFRQLHITPHSHMRWAERPAGWRGF